MPPPARIPRRAVTYGGRALPSLLDGLVREVGLSPSAITHDSGVARQMTDHVHVTCAGSVGAPCYHQDTAFRAVGADRQVRCHPDEAAFGAEAEMTKIDPTYRTADVDDLPAIVALLADDPLGARRERFENPLPDAYLRAFAAIEHDANNELLVAELDGELVGVLQLTLIPNLTYQGSWRAQIEGVRTAPSVRGRGVGRGLVTEAIERARAAGCRLIQLTTDKTRPDAVRFYEALGFRASHEGMKRALVEPG